MRLLNILVGLMLCMLSSMARAAIHSYKLPRISATAESCEVRAREVLERFSDLARGSVLGHGCERDLAGFYDLVIDYAKPSMANLVSTFSEFDFVHGLFSSNDDCSAHYSEEMASFRSATGIEPIIAYCFPALGGWEPNGLWIMRIDGFGVPQASPRHIVADLSFSLVGDMSTFSSQITASLHAFGAQGVRVKISADRDRSTIHAFYYGEKDVPLVEFTDAQFDTLESCEAYRAQMSEVYARAGGQSLLHVCGGNSYSASVFLYTAGLVIEPLASELLSLKYPSHAACEADRNRTQSAWGDALDQAVIGSMCLTEVRITDQVVRMRLFWLE
jgi:hypothetical protein